MCYYAHLHTMAFQRVLIIIYFIVVWKVLHFNLNAYAFEIWNSYKRIQLHVVIFLKTTKYMFISISVMGNIWHDA